MSWIMIDSSLKGSIWSPNSMIKSPYFLNDSQQRSRTPASVVPVRKGIRKQQRSTSASAVRRRKTINPNSSGTKNSNDNSNINTNKKKKKDKKSMAALGQTTTTINGDKRSTEYRHASPAGSPMNSIETDYDEKSQSFLDRAWGKFGEARVLTQQKLFQSAWQALMEAKELIDTAGDISRVATDSGIMMMNNNRQQQALVQLGHELNIATQAWLVRERLTGEETPTKCKLMRSGSATATVRALQQQHYEEEQQLLQQQQQQQRAKEEEKEEEEKEEKEKEELADITVDILDEKKNNDTFIPDISSNHNHHNHNNHNHRIHSDIPGVSLDIHSSNTNIYLDRWTHHSDMGLVNSHSPRLRELWDTTVQTPAKSPNLRYSDGIVAAMRRANVWEAATATATPQIISAIPSTAMEEDVGCIQRQDRQERKEKEKQEEEQEGKYGTRNIYKRFTQDVSTHSTVSSLLEDVNRLNVTPITVADTLHTSPVQESRKRSILDLGEPQLVPLYAFEVVKPKTPRKKDHPLSTPIVSVPVASHFDHSAVDTTTNTTNSNIITAVAAQVPCGTTVQTVSSCAIPEEKEKQPSLSSSSVIVSNSYRGPVVTSSVCYGSIRAGGEMRGGESIRLPQYVNIYNIKQGNRDTRQGMGETTTSNVDVDPTTNDNGNGSTKMFDLSKKESLADVDTVFSTHDVMKSVKRDVISTSTDNVKQLENTQLSVKSLQQSTSHNTTTTTTTTSHNTTMHDDIPGEKPEISTVDHENSDVSMYDTVPLTESALQHYFDDVDNYQEARVLHQRMVRYLLCERSVEEEKEEERKQQGKRPSRAAYLLGLLEESYHDWLVDHLGIKKRHRSSGSNIKENRQTLSTASVTTSEYTQMESRKETESIHIHESRKLDIASPEMFESTQEPISSIPPATPRETETRKTIANEDKTKVQMEEFNRIPPREIQERNGMNGIFSHNVALKHVEETKEEEEEEKKEKEQQHEGEEYKQREEEESNKVHPVSTPQRSGRTFVFVREKGQ
ncbi:uncharacterized protein TM35_000211720 [Trypanosoma theileri]|uniref:Uncharacterized protein n=1 Tax=Trypanosoma theileri TaxID=67003 RepID=A0A1X0NS97_9TRYP|nr:uncharacterized protein TM35_000211720 [Trypanosoma theileri]ORC87566.1 hypothetical protein TM35_000211720 [Trypanosoma theileri]